MKNYYLVLGLYPSSTDYELRNRYRELTRKHHPDIGGDAAFFAEVTEAGSTLCDPDRRRDYDRRMTILMDPCPKCAGEGVTRTQVSITSITTRRCAVCQGAGYHERT